MFCITNNKGEFMLLVVIYKGGENGALFSPYPGIHFIGVFTRKLEKFEISENTR